MKRRSRTIKLQRFEPINCDRCRPTRSSFSYCRAHNLSTARYASDSQSSGTRYSLRDYPLYRRGHSASSQRACAHHFPRGPCRRFHYGTIESRPSLSRPLNGKKVSFGRARCYLGR